MKLRTNLKPSELRKVGIGLQKLSDAQQNELVLENSAERELIAKTEELFDLAMANLASEVERIVKEEEHL